MAENSETTFKLLSHKLVLHIVLAYSNYMTYSGGTLLFCHFFISILS